MSDEKSVVETTEEEQRETEAASKANDAQEENLDDLLKEFEGGEESTTEQKEETEPDVKQLAERLRQFEELQQRQAFETEMSELAATVRGDLPEEVFDNEVITSYLDAKARKDPRLQKAFMNRHNSPSQWNGIVKGVAREFQNKFKSLPNREATEDAHAVESAVRSASTKAPEADEEISHEKARKMSDDDLREYLKKYAPK